MFNNSVFKDIVNLEYNSPRKGYPKDPKMYALPEEWKFPLDTKDRVRSAISYFSKHPWENNDVKKKAAKRILKAAKVFDITVSKETEVYKASL